MILCYVIILIYLEINTWPPPRYQAYQSVSCVGPRPNIECRANMPGNVTTMFLTFYYMFVCGSLSRGDVNDVIKDTEGAHKG